ncbi:MAG: pyridoxal-phosphate dependent enzyme [Pseudomonadota bacterium]
MNRATFSPLMRATRLAEKIGVKDLWFKRDDMLPPLPGGNKVRKLEGYIARAREIGATRLIACGGTQSNHARLTAAMACQHGLDCTVVLRRMPFGDDPMYAHNGNQLLLQVLGADVVEAAPDDNLDALMDAESRKARAAGETPLIIPFGGSGLEGTRALLPLVDELAIQCREAGIKPGYIAVTNGSHGTHAALIAGCLMRGWGDITLGYSVLHNSAVAVDATNALVIDVLEAEGRTDLISAVDCTVKDHALGEGYGYPTQAATQAIFAAGQSEAILLDPVYTGKAMAGLIADVKSQRLDAERPIIFIHTGGMAGLFAYQQILATSLP